MSFPASTYFLLSIEVKGWAKLNNRGNNKYVYNNLKTLETWSGHQVDTVLYDSDIDGKDSSIFKNKIMQTKGLWLLRFLADSSIVAVKVDRFEPVVSHLQSSK